MKRCEKEIPEQSWRERERWIGLAAQLYVSEYLVLTGKKKGDSKYGMRASLLRRNTTFSFFPQKYEWKIWAECFHEEKKTWSGFFFFFFPGLFCFSAGRETEKCLSRCFCLSGAAAWALNIVGSLGNTSGSKTCITLRCELRPWTYLLKDETFSMVG